MTSRPFTMAMASSKLVFLFLFVSFLNCATTEAADVTYLYHNCSRNKTFPANSAYQLDLTTLLSSLSSSATGNTEFYNTTVADRNPSDIVYGLFMCQGAVSSQICHQCVINATQRLSSECRLYKEAIIWYDECLLRYSNRSFFSTVDTRPRLGLLNTANISNQESFMRLLFNTLNETADEAAKPPLGAKKYSTKQASMSGFQSLYCLAQCTPDLSPQDCRRCLSGVIGDLPWCCTGKQGGRVLYPSCNVRYELYPFYHAAAPAPTPTTPAKPKDDPVYFNHTCISNKTFTPNSGYQFNLKTLLSSLSSNATGNTEFYHTTAGGRNTSDTIYGLFMCRGDVPHKLCQDCVASATNRIASDCLHNKEALIWYDECLVRYSYRSVFPIVEEDPLLVDLRIGSPGYILDQENFSLILENTLNEVVVEAAKSGPGASSKKFATKEENLPGDENLYSLAQCTPDLSSQDCSKCLRVVIRHIRVCCQQMTGGRVLYPGCNLRFELYPFYSRDIAEAPPPRSPLPTSPIPMVDGSDATGKEKGRTTTIIIVIIAVLIIISMILFCYAYYLLRRKKQKSYEVVLRENFGNESTTLESLQFSLATIEDATNKFSHDNRIGKGGFGEVYKGILFDGREIAIKRLSRSSGQGAVEFKNEVLLIAKLQHRNLVTLLGFCLEEREKILIYEYVANKSLDHFLFGSQKKRVLNWLEPYKIIGGIARGILYLHEYSRVKIIHRDLKPSNILLDDNMNPKISDFGLARMVAIDETEGSTNRIVGTYGYMSPEYAMLGQFSEKSDVFSFGVIILEIISGKKNVSRYESQEVDGLLSYAWKQWKNEKLLEILDSNMPELGSHSEVIKCIQIGLLCVQENPKARPSMVTVVSYLSSHSIELPIPQEPAFFMQGRVEPPIGANESGSSQHTNNSKPCSVNEMALSEFFPR